MSFETTNESLRSHFRFFVVVVVLFFFWGSTAGVVQDLSSLPGIEPVSAAVEVQCLNHWSTREVPDEPF